MVESTKNGTVIKRENGTVIQTGDSIEYSVKKSPKVEASTVIHSGHTCTIKGQGQRITVGVYASISNTGKAKGKANVFVGTDEKHGNMNRITDNEGNVVIMGDGRWNPSFADIQPSSGDGPLNRSLPDIQPSQITGKNEMGTRNSLMMPVDVLRQLGVTCTNPQGKPSAPVLSVGDVQKLAESVVRK